MVQEKAIVQDAVTLTLKRGPASWAFIYVALGFALSIEGTILQMFEPLRFPYNLFAYLAFAAATVWLFIFNGWFQNKLLVIKNRYEEGISK